MDCYTRVRKAGAPRKDKQRDRPGEKVRLPCEIVTFAMVIAYGWRTKCCGRSFGHTDGPPGHIAGEPSGILELAVMFDPGLWLRCFYCWCTCNIYIYIYIYLGHPAYFLNGLVAWGIPREAVEENQQLNPAVWRCFACNPAMLIWCSELPFAFHAYALFPPVA